MLTEVVISILILLVLLLSTLYYITKRKLDLVLDSYSGLHHDYLSKAVKHGRNWEQFAPFMEEFSKISNKENFCFLGQPIDGISFDNDSIKLIEFKTGNSQLSKKQKYIKHLVENKKVSFHEIRF